MKLNNKRILITGGTSGIGYELVKHLHEQNQVIVIARHVHKLDELARQFTGIMTYQADLSKMEDINNAADAIRADVASIDVLINNAAVQYTPTFLDEQFDYDSISHEISINFTSICALTYRLLPLLLRQDDAVILNVNSGLALAPKTSSAIYCATKSALNSFTQSLGYQLEATGVQVQQVFLGLVDTAMTKGRGDNKMLAPEAARRIVGGVERGLKEHYLGKVYWLQILLRLMPSVARNIMRQH
ncbi:MAG: SDR family oxidoreductase [Arenicella sp.]